MSNIYYLPTHEYARVEGNVAYIGISEFAAKSLGNVVYVDMPEDGDDVVKGEDFGAVEMTDPSELESLLSPEDYAKLCESEQH